MVETLFFIGGTITGFILSWASFNSGSNSTHQAYDIVYQYPEIEDEPKDGEKAQRTYDSDSNYNWSEYESSYKYLKFEEDEDDLDEKPN